MGKIEIQNKDNKEETIDCSKEYKRIKVKKTNKYVGKLIIIDHRINV